MIRTIRLLVVAAALLGFLQFSRADAPNGTLTFDFSVTNSPIFDVGGDYQFDQVIIGAGGTEIPFSYGVSFTQDVRGLLLGQGETIVNVGNDFVAAAYSVRGRISGGGPETRVVLVIRLKGEDFITGVLTPFNITVVYDFIVDTDSGTLIGSARGSAHFGHLGNGRILSEVQASLPPGADGSWTLQLNVVPFDHLAGTAQILLSNGRILQAHLSGSYAPDLDRSVIRVNGFADSRGNSILIIFTSEDVLLVRGRVLGQLVNQ